MKFNLENGQHTEVLFFKDVTGFVQAFPRDNVALVQYMGTEEAKKRLKEFLGK